MHIEIVDHSLAFASALTKRSKTTKIVLHHSDSLNGTVETIHGYHKNTKGWAGIGYNFVVYKDGTVHKGRGWEYAGAHAAGSNAVSVGICFIGKYHDTDTVMPDAQFNSGVALVALAQEKYPAITEVAGHRDVQATACPGRYFPFGEMIAGNYRGIPTKTETEDEDMDVTRFKELYDEMIAQTHGDDPSEWAAEACEKAKAAGVFTGDGQGNYEWKEPLTREAFAIVLSRLGLLG